MVLKKKIIARSGIELEYWKIFDWRINMAHKIMDITLVPYVSESTKQEGLEPVYEEARKIRIYDDINKVQPENSVYNYTNYFSPEALEASELDIYKIMYNYIKEHVPEFKNSEDC